MKSVDAQGASFDIISGGKRCLQQEALGVRCEAELTEVYLKAKRAYALGELLESLGFRLLRVERCGPGSWGISTDMNRFSVSHQDALPVWTDMIWINERLLKEQLNTAPAGALF